jgi:hypothetical protein
LEAFVSGGTAQIQVIATGVDKLCQQSGCLRDGQATHQTAVLQASINNLAALISSESQSFSADCFQQFVQCASLLRYLAAQSIARLIEQQRQEQEGLLRALTAGRHISSIRFNGIYTSDQNYRTKFEGKGYGLWMP